MAARTRPTWVVFDADPLAGMRRPLTPTELATMSVRVVRAAGAGRAVLHRYEVTAQLRAGGVNEARSHVARYLGAAPETDVMPVETVVINGMARMPG